MLAKYAADDKQMEFSDDFFTGAFRVNYVYHFFYLSSLSVPLYTKYTWALPVYYVISIVPVYTPANFVCGGYTVFTSSVCASVRNVLFP